MKSKSFLLVLIVMVTLLVVLYFNNPSHSIEEEWPEYLRGPERNHYSRLTQIDTANVSGQCNPVAEKWV